MSIQKILDMANEFIAQAEGEVSLTPTNTDYQEQRDKLAQFYDFFAKQLRRIINEMGGDMFVLKERGFDPKLLKKFAEVQDALVKIMKSIDEDKPYIAAEALVQFATERMTAAILENLDVIIAHHLQKTNVDFGTSKLLKHPEVDSLKNISALAKQLKRFMEKNPLIVPPRASEIPARLQDNIKDLPTFSAGHEDKTNPAVPIAKK